MYEKDRRVGQRGEVIQEVLVPNHDKLRRLYRE
jgi:hypothetical protein